MFSTFDPRRHQRHYSETELEEQFDFEEQTTAYSSSRKKNPFINDEAEGDSFRDFDSDYDDVTIKNSPLKVLSPPRSTSLSDLRQPKRRRILEKLLSNH